MSLIIREMQTKKNNGYPSKGPKPASASEDAGVLLNAATIWNTVEVSPRFKKKIEAEYAPALPLVETYPKEIKSACQRDIYTPMLTTAPFTVAGMETS